MTTKNWNSTAVSILHEAGVSTSALDTEVLLSDILTVDRSWLHAHPEFELTNEQITSLNAQIERRKNHEPLAYIRGKQEFYNRDFFVSPDTLTPRPETETMIEMLLEDMRHESRVMSQEKLQGTLCSEQGAMSSDKGNKKLNITPTPSTSYNLPPTTPLQIIDIGTGSGCILITAALELSMTHDSRLPAHFLGLDISKKALNIAQKNATRHEANVELKEFDLRKDSLYSLLPTYSSLIILANLPYVPDDFHINLAASHEPSFAIFGGKDGLDYYRVLFAQLNMRSNEQGAMSKNAEKTAVVHSSLPFGPESITVLTESLPPQHEELEKIASAHGFALKKSQDFIQFFSNQ